MYKYYTEENHMKKAMSLMLCLMMVVSMVIQSFALTNNTTPIALIDDDGFVLGDANGDGAIDMKDSLELRKHCADGSALDEMAADINADGKVNAKDLLILKRCNAELESIEEYDSAYAVDRLTIAGNDISKYCIVYPAEGKYVENAYYSADTLRKYINVSTGVNLPIVTEATTDKVIQFVDVCTIEGLEEDLGVESYKYEVKDGNLYIYGTRRGNMYAVNSILEDYLGYRFFNDTYTYIYNSRVIDIPEDTDVTYRPAMDFRYAGQNFGNNKTGYYFMRGLNGTAIYSHAGVEYGTLTGPHFINAHSYGYYWKMATGEVDVTFNGSNRNDYAAKYEAGFQQKELEWNPCSTDDMVYATLFRGLLETMRYVQGWHTFRDETSSMSFSICDNANYYCDCINCRYISSSGTDKGRGERLNAGGTGLNIYLANRACRDIETFYESWEEIDGELYWTGRPAGVDETGLAAEEDWYSYGYGEAIRDVYPGMKLFTIFYDHTPPSENLFTDERYKDLIPEDNLILMYCGNPCNNHKMGSDDCNGGTNILGQSAAQGYESIKGWGQACKKAGAEIWFWYYGVSYNTYLSDSPNIFNLWYDYKWMVEECNVTGFFYEGGGKGYMFESLKAYLSAQLSWNMEEDEDGNITIMSYEEFVDCMKEYLMMYYGDGYEYIYEYIVMQDEASELTGCYVNNLDYPGDMFDYTYMRDNYEHMRELVLKAIAAAEHDYQRHHCEYLLVNAEFLGLSAVYESWYNSNDSDPAKKEAYEERFVWLYNYIKNSGMDIWVYNINDIPCDVTVHPMQLYYKGGSWNPDNADTWTWTGSIPSWGFHG